jgi:hypothetical protein
MLQGRNASTSLSICVFACFNAFLYVFLSIAGA